MRAATFKTEEFDANIQLLLEEWKVPGITIAVVDGDDTHVKNFGFANLPEQKHIDNETLFDCASTSKSFTAAAVALVIEDCQKSNDAGVKARDFKTPVKEFLPEDFVLSDPYYTENVTVEDILSHRSGMPRHDDSYLGIRAKEPDNPRSMTRNLRNLPLTRPLRTTYQYCNMMYTVSTHLVSEVSGVPFDTFLKDRIWTPLDMNNTYLNLPGRPEFEARRPQMAIGYYWSKDEEVQKPVPFFDQPEGLGAGSIFSTVSDYAKWIRCMLKQSEPFSKTSHEELRKPRIIADPDDPPKNGFSNSLYALGWETLTYRGHHLIGHDGCVWGFGSCMKYLPKHDWGIVLFSNGNEGANECIEAIAMTLIDEVLGVPVSDRLDWYKEKMEQFKKDKEKEDTDDEEEATDEATTELPLHEYAGFYHDQGYHAIRIEVKEDYLSGDCTDRAFPFYIEMRRTSGGHFRAKLRDLLDGQTEPLKVKFELGQSSKLPVRFGVNLELAMGDELIWFDRVN